MRGVRVWSNIITPGWWSAGLPYGGVTLIWVWREVDWCQLAPGGGLGGWGGWGAGGGSVRVNTLPARTGNCRPSNLTGIDLVCHGSGKWVGWWGEGGAPCRYPWPSSLWQHAITMTTWHSLKSSTFADCYNQQTRDLFCPQVSIGTFRKKPTTGTLCPTLLTTK